MCLQVGNHIDVMSGKWTALDAGIGAGVDSYFEYLVKGAALFQYPQLIEQFHGEYPQLIEQFHGEYPQLIEQFHMVNTHS